MAVVQVRKRLLFGSLAVSAVMSTAIGWAIAQNSSSPGGGGADGGADVDVGLIETNDDVRGEPLPDATVQTLEGAAVRIASLTGQPLVLNVWSSTCIPCREELPDYAAVHQRYGDRVRFVGIDYLGASAIEEDFARDKGVQYELLYDTNGEFIVATGLAAFPVTLFVAPDGTVVRQTGQLDQAELEQYVQELLA